MIAIRREEYNNYTQLPFILNSDITRSSRTQSKERNWHEDLEIELCTQGSGTLLLNGEKFSFEKDDIAVIGSNLIHYTGAFDSMKYTCIIISAEFCKRVGFAYEELSFSPILKDAALINLIKELTKLYQNRHQPYRIAKLHALILNLLIMIGEKYSVKKTALDSGIKSFENVKKAIGYIRNNYYKKITLDNISKAIYFDKYALCRDFKKATGKTIIEYTNHYRCQKAGDYMLEGYTVSQAANMCGFENLSFFTKTFKTQMGCLPSKYAK